MLCRINSELILLIPFGCLVQSDSLLPPLKSKVRLKQKAKVLQIFLSTETGLFRLMDYFFLLTGRLYWLLGAVSNGIELAINQYGLRLPDTQFGALV